MASLLGEIFRYMTRQSTRLNAMDQRVSKLEGVKGEILNHLKSMEVKYDQLRQEVSDRDTVPNHHGSSEETHFDHEFANQSDFRCQDSNFIARQPLIVDSTPINIEPPLIVIWVTYLQVSSYNPFFCERYLHPTLCNLGRSTQFG